MKRPVKPLLIASAASLALVLGILALGGEDTVAATDGNPQAMQAIPVSVVTIQENSTRTWSEFSGKMQAVDYVEIRPRVSGTIDKVLFEEGSMVQKGQLLFEIDPRPYAAAVANAQAALNSARTQAELAKKELDRAEMLVGKKVISRSAYDERARNYRVANANIEGAEAALRQAKLDLEYAHIRAPITGRISRAEITEGNLVEAGFGNAPLLTTIVSSDPIYADFDVDEQTYLASIRKDASAAGKDAEIPVELSLAGESATRYRGIIKSFDNRINPSSGTIRARAEIRNEEGTLVPGMFVTVHLGKASPERVILLTDRAISTDQDKKFVYVVGEENKVAYREVTLGAKTEGLRIITAGLKPGEKVIVNGIMKVRPDMVVAPEEVTLESLSSPVKTSKASQ
jgi:multidrug efflux system membrane fusion protein